MHQRRGSRFWREGLSNSKRRGQQQAAWPTPGRRCSPAYQKKLFLRIGCPPSDQTPSNFSPVKPSRSTTVLNSNSGVGVPVTANRVPPFGSRKSDDFSKRDGWK